MAYLEKCSDLARFFYKPEDNIFLTQPTPKSYFKNFDPAYVRF